MAKAITGTRTLKAADKAGPKAGSAQGNQSTRVTKSDTIVSVKGDVAGKFIIVTATGNPPVAVPNSRFVGKVQKAGVVGGSYAAFTAVWADAKANPPTAKLANGLDTQNSPHAAKAVRDARAKAAPPVAAKKAARIAASKVTATPKADDARAIKVLNKDFGFGREGTSRRASWDACLKSATVVAYAKAGGAVKYLQRWSAAGAIKLG